MFYLQRIADTKEPLDGDGKGHEDTASQSNITENAAQYLWYFSDKTPPERIDQGREKDSEDVTSSFKRSSNINDEDEPNNPPGQDWPAGVTDASTQYEQTVEAGKSEEEVVETILVFCWHSYYTFTIILSP